MNWTGHEKSHVSVCITAKADGTKFPLIVFKGFKQETYAVDKEFQNCVIAIFPNEWTNTKMIHISENKILALFSFYLICTGTRCKVEEAI